MNEIDVILVIADEDNWDYTRISRALKHLAKKVDRVMADLTGLRQAVADVQATDTAAAAEIAALAGKVEELTAGDVSQADIDGIAADLEAAATALAKAGPVAPPVEPPAEEEVTPPAEEPPAEETPPVEPPAEEEPPVEQPPVEPPVEPPAEEGQVPSGTVPADESGEPSA